MKNLFKARIVPLFGIIVLAAVIGFSMVACDDGSNNNGGNNGIDNNNGGGSTTGSIRMENRTGVTIVRIGVNQGSSLLQNFNVNVPNGGSYTISNVSSGSYFLTIFDDVSGYYPVPLMVSRTLTVTAGQTVTWQAQ
jgi:hypothetical protein